MRYLNLIDTSWQVSKRRLDHGAYGKAGNGKHGNGNWIMENGKWKADTSARESYSEIMACACDFLLLLPSAVI